MNWCAVCIICLVKSASHPIVTQTWLWIRSNVWAQFCIILTTCFTIILKAWFIILSYAKCSITSTVLAIRSVKRIWKITIRFIFIRTLNKIIWPTICSHLININIRTRSILCKTISLIQIITKIIIVCETTTCVKKYSTPIYINLIIALLTLIF